MPIAVKDLTKSFGAKQVLRGVQFSVNKGELLSLLGPNGAGKSTVFSLVAGLRTPDTGEVLVDGYLPRSLEARKRFRLSPQDCDFPKTVKAKEIFDYISAFGSAIWKDRVRKEFLLESFWHLQTGALSGGQKRRLSLALAFCSKPQYVILDEPSAGLDLESRRALWSFLKAYCHEGGSCLLSTHYLEEAEYLSDRIHVLKEGRSVFEGTPDDLKKRTQNMKLTYKIYDQINTGSVQTVLTRDTDTEVKKLVNSGVNFYDLKIESASLEESFLGLVSQ